MPVQRSLKRKAPSTLSYATNKATKTRRVSRSGRVLKKPGDGIDSSFVDSTVIEGLSTDDEAVVSDNENIKVKPRPRLAATPEPYRKIVSQTAIPSDSENGFGSGSDDEEDGKTTVLPAQGLHESHTNQPFQIVLQVPKGPARQITLDISANDFINTAQATAVTKKKAVPTADPQDKNNSIIQALPPKASKDIIKNAGLIGKLPGELRMKIYMPLFVSQGSIDLGRPDAEFSRSAAFLRSCRLVHGEGHHLLYGRNRFLFRTSSKQYGSLWEGKWKELDYSIGRAFMKLIGPHNIALLRDVELQIQDLSLSGHRDMEAGERLAVNNETLLSIMRDLARYAEIHFLRVEVYTRRHLSRTDSYFVDTLTRIKVDKLEFDDFAHPSPYMRHATFVPSLPQHAKNFIAYCRKKMVRKVKLHPDYKRY